MGKQVFVKNVPWQATEQDVETFFAGCGGIERVRIITDRETRRSKGFGFVTFKTESSARAAIAMSGKEFQGRVLYVNEATDSGRGQR